MSACHICKRVQGTIRCPRCGRTVCPECFGNNMCKFCQAEFTKPQQSNQPTQPINQRMPPPPQNPYQPANHPQTSSFTKGAGQGVGICAGCAVVAVVLFFIFLFIGIGSGINESTSSTSSSTPDTDISSPASPSSSPSSSDTDSLLTLQNGWTLEEGKIKGTIVNNTDRTFSYVQVTFNLYDSAGNQVGSTLANINNLEPHGSWNFEAVYLEENVARARFTGIDSW